MIRRRGGGLKPAVEEGETGERGGTATARPDGDGGGERANAGKGRAGPAGRGGGQVPGARLSRERSWLTVTQAKVTTRRMVDNALMRGGAPYLIML